jgi:uncharacterized protein with FMN-binding domain
MSISEDGKVKKKHKGRGCLIALMIFVVVIGAGLGIGWFFLSAEHKEAANLPLNKINFNKLTDGTYHGVYAGGMYKWRVSECQVAVASGKVTNILLLATIDHAASDSDTKMLFDRVIKAQSLKVDTVSSATLTSNAYLQCVENALIPAQHN